MGHQSGKGAERAVKNSQRSAVAETRTSEAIIKGIRGNLAAHLAVTPNDTAFLLAQLDSAAVTITAQYAVIAGHIAKEEDMQAKLDEFRDVYERENRSSLLLVTPEAAKQLETEFTTPVALPRTYGEKLEAEHFVAPPDGGYR